MISSSKNLSDYQEKKLLSFLDRSLNGYFILTAQPKKFFLCKNNDNSGATFHFINQRIPEFTGYSKKFFDTRPVDAINNIVPKSTLRDIHEYAFHKEKTYIYQGIIPLFVKIGRIAYFKTRMEVVPIAPEKDLYEIVGTLEKIYPAEGAEKQQHYSKDLRLEILEKHHKLSTFVQDKYGNYIDYVLNIPDEDINHKIITQAKNIKEILPEKIIKKEQSLVQAALKNKKTYSHCYLFRQKYYECTISPYSGGLVFKVVKDISEQYYNKKLIRFREKTHTLRSLKEMQKNFSSLFEELSSINHFAIVKYEAGTFQLLHHKNPYNFKFPPNEELPKSLYAICVATQSVFLFHQSQKAQVQKDYPYVVNFPPKDIHQWIGIPVKIHQATYIVGIDISPFPFYSKMWLKTIQQGVDIFFHRYAELLYQEKLKETQQYYQALIENTSDIILQLNTQGEILYASPAVKKILEYDPEELIHQSWFSLVLKKDQKELKNKYIKFIQHRQSSCEHIYRVKTKKGKTIWIRGKSVRVSIDNHSETIIASISDISAIKEMHRLTEEQNQLLRIFISKTSDGVLYCSKDGKIIEVNDFFTKEFGLPKDQILFNNIFSLFDNFPKDTHIVVSDSYFSEFKTKLKKLLTSKTSLEETVALYNKNHILQTYHITSSPLLFNKNHIGTFLILQNISRIEREKQLRTSIAIKAQEKERRYIGQELHDGLGQILTACSFKLQTLQYEIKKLKNPDLYQLVDSSNELFTQAMKDARQISHALRPVALEKFGLNAIILETINTLKDRLKIIFNSNLHTLRFDINFETSLYRIIQELINNAMKHAKADAFKIQLSYFDNRKKIVLITHDNGKKPININALLTNNNGIGYENIKNRVYAYNGNMHIAFNNGLKHTFIFPDIEAIKNSTYE